MFYTLINFFHSLAGWLDEVVRRGPARAISSVRRSGAFAVQMRNAENVIFTSSRSFHSHRNHRSNAEESEAEAEDGGVPFVEIERMNKTSWQKSYFFQFFFSFFTTCTQAPRQGIRVLLRTRSIRTLYFDGRNTILVSAGGGVASRQNLVARTVTTMRMISSSVCGAGDLHPFSFSPIDPSL